MKKNLLFFIFLSGMFMLGACAQKNIPANKSAYKLHHIVLFNFKEGAPIDTIEQAMYQLFGSIKGVSDLSFNKNVSSRNLDKGYKYSFYMTFESAFDRDSVFYPHPNYKKMGGVIGKHINEYLIYDYEIPAKSIK